MPGGRGPTLRRVNESFIAALQANPLPEFLERLTGGNHGFREAPALFHVLCSFAEKTHPGGELQAQVTQIGGAAGICGVARAVPLSYSVSLHSQSPAQLREAHSHSSCQL